jgi:hypothetical protein
MMEEEDGSMPKKKTDGEVMEVTDLEGQAREEETLPPVPLTATENSQEGTNAPTEKAVQETDPVPESGEEEPVIPLHPALSPPTLHFPPGRLAQVENNPNLRRIGAILANGTRFSQNVHINFNAHHGLLIQLRNAFEAREQDVEKASADFFETLATYLTQADGRIPHTMKASEVAESVQQAKTLVHTVNAEGHRTDGFEQVARYLLLLANAPLAQF